jgi:hypothetical protein
MKSFKEFSEINEARPALTAENVKDELLYAYGSEEAINEALNRSVKRVEQHVAAGRPIALLSASRGERSPADNNKAHAELQSHIKQHGFGHSRVLGVGQENTDGGEVKPTHEHSFMVVGKKDDKGHLEKFARSMGDKFGQHSVIVHRSGAAGATLVHTAGSETPGKEEHLGALHGDTLSAYHTKLKGPRGFHYESVYILQPPTFFKRAWTLGE